MILLVLAAYWRLAFLQAIPGEEDNFTFNFPYKAVFSDFLKKGELPFWSPYAAFGFPQYAQGITASFYLIDLVFYRFLPLIPAFNYTLLLHLLLIATFTFFFARTIKISPEGSFLSAIAFTFCGWVLGLLGAVQNLYPLAWLPVSFFLVELYFKKKNSVYLLLAALVLAQCILASFPQITLYVIYGCSFYFLWRTFTSIHNWKNRIYHLSCWGVVLALAASLSAVWTLPLFELIKFSPRAEGVSLSYAQQGSFNPLFLIFNLFPNLLLGKNGTIGRYICLYLGILPLFFAFFALAKKEKKLTVLFFLLLLAFSFLISLGKYNPLYPIFLKLPGFSYFRQPWRILFLAEFSLALLAGIGFDNFSAQKRRKIKFLIILALLLSFCAFLMLLTRPLLLELLTSKKIILGLSSLKPSFLLLPAGVFLFSSILILLYQKRIISLGAFKNLALSFIVLDLLLFGWQGRAFGFFPLEKFSRYYQESPGANFLKNDKGIYRIYSLPVPHQEPSKEELYPSKERFWEDTMKLLLTSNNMLFKVQSVAQSDFALGLKNTIKINELLEGKSAEGHLYDPKNRERVKKLSKLLGFLNVKYVLTKEVINSPHYLLAEMGKYKIYQNKDFLPRALVVNNFSHTSAPIVPALKGFQTELRLSRFIEDNPQGKNRKAVILNYQPTSIAIGVKSSKEGYLLLTDAFYPGWKATVNGKETKVYLSDYAFRAVKIPEGESAVRFWFQPESYARGLKISLIGLGLWSVFLAFSLRMSNISENSPASPQKD